ncbi:hypothetical protein [Mycobacterium sp. 236(2023)]|uniref:hypothetical protein n=1 Tax=Mycobacterium sp. 236(2023) TaxID=3038163 RepID=UPI00241531B0|nr:hypothetical protein [Mycobacterium sp. 236(2023)]MDG4667852.1 hypothetical protein [Mycobacterium sp. 236(2023)]
MSSPADPVRTGANGEDSARGMGAQQPVALHNCSRIGRVANPPGFSFSGWFRSSRRR